MSATEVDKSPFSPPWKLAEVVMAQGTSEANGGGNGQKPFWEHMDQWMELVMSFNGKMYNQELGPCDAKLYMQACDLLSSYAMQLERTMLDEDRNSNTGGKPSGDAKPESDRPPDPTV